MPSAWGAWVTAQATAQCKSAAWCSTARAGPGYGGGTAVGLYPGRLEQFERHCCPEPGGGPGQVAATPAEAVVALAATTPHSPPVLSLTGPNWGGYLVSGGPFRSVSVTVRIPVQRRLLQRGALQLGRH